MKKEEQKNDFSKAEIGQKLYSLKYGIVNVYKLGKARTYCKKTRSKIY